MPLWKKNRFKSWKLLNFDDNLFQNTSPLHLWCPGQSEEGLERGNTRKRLTNQECHHIRPNNFCSCSGAGDGRIISNSSSSWISLGQKIQGFHCGKLNSADAMNDVNFESFVNLITFRIRFSLAYYMNSWLHCLCKQNSHEVIIMFTLIIPFYTFCYLYCFRVWFQFKIHSTRPSLIL